MTEALNQPLDQPDARRVPPTNSLRQAIRVPTVYQVMNLALSLLHVPRKLCYFRFPLFSPTDFCPVRCLVGYYTPGSGASCGPAAVNYFVANSGSATSTICGAGSDTVSLTAASACTP